MATENEKVQVWAYKVTDIYGESATYVSNDGGEEIIIEDLTGKEGIFVYGELNHWEIEPFCKKNGLKLSASQFELELDKVI